jgi:hypothetical protein
MVDEIDYFIDMPLISLMKNFATPMLPLLRQHCNTHWQVPHHGQKSYIM